MKDLSYNINEPLVYAFPTVPGVSPGERSFFFSYAIVNGKLLSSKVERLFCPRSKVPVRPVAPRPLPVRLGPDNAVFALLPRARIWHIVFQISLPAYVLLHTQL